MVSKKIYFIAIKLLFMINVLIPAAGKGTRSNLKYPKTLYKIKGTPIIISLIKTIISCKIKLNKI